jgi:DNA topoisomerase I
MSDNLMIVESPAKAGTIKKYLGKDFEVMASYGHVRDLPSKDGMVDVDNGFTMQYATIERNKKHVDNMVKAMRKAKVLYLATDLDREGEAIAWHVQELLKQKKVLKEKPVKRVVFHEITKRALREAVDNPRELSMDMVDAQQARRALDYLVGFKLSPLLWKKVRRGLSAGRVQSPALRMIVERAQEIESFKPREYWSLNADLDHQTEKFSAKLIRYLDKKLSQFSIEDEARATAVRDDLLSQAEGFLSVDKVEKKQRKRNPAPPFTTSTLQQEAARKLRFSAKKTMMVAQQLYEGVDIGTGSVGLISYMRTDSVSLAAEAVEDIRVFVNKRYGDNHLPEKPRTFKTKAKNAQEAHEAIRPTAVKRIPDDLSAALSKDQLKLYRLIWQRTVACQMIHATIDAVSIDLGCGVGNVFRATGSTIAHKGFMTVYQEGLDDNASNHDEEGLLPLMKEGDRVALEALQAKQHFTEPPPQYTEATLVKSLEEYGIGRPSTYAAIISTLQDREYVKLEKRRFSPTDVGRVVSRFLTEHFTRYVDYEFTAHLEDELDEVSRGEKHWIPLMESFWKPFNELLKLKEESVSRKDVTQEEMDEACPKCNKPLSIRLGRNGRFIGCTDYPTCDYTRNMDGAEEAEEPTVLEDRQCPKCQSPLLIRHGRYGKFIGCSDYPTCKHVESLHQPEETGVLCPDCQKGALLKRKSRNDKVFYSCSTYPDCRYAVWNAPINESCPDCQWPILTIKTTKSKGTQKVCPQKTCHFAESCEEEVTS